MELVLASSNRGKLAEMAALLAPLAVTVRSPADFPGWPEIAETGATFAENAVLKAEAGCAFSGLPTVADDSGLEVEALGGAPGIYSARYAGTQGDAAANNALLLRNLQGVPWEKRGARFVCAVAFVAAPGAEAKVFVGETRGRVLEAPRGAEGFGYDPLFLSDDLRCSFAEADAAAKNRVSHRGRALSQLTAYLKTMGERA
ncbi:MAG: XTP/dITP diphosphatase [Planctomycetes bacterium]|nr:XTP/dITP diphosphatase [Planctomycetota bacterium]